MSESHAVAGLLANLRAITYLKSGAGLLQTVHTSVSASHLLCEGLNCPQSRGLLALSVNALRCVPKHSLGYTQC